jgi:hypothetical protein
MEECYYSKKDFTQIQPLPFCNFNGACLYEYYSDEDLNFPHFYVKKADYYLVLSRYSDFNSVSDDKK